MLLYLVKHSRPNTANSVQELSKAADGAIKYHWQKLLRNIKFVLDTELLALKMKPNQREKPNRIQERKQCCTMSATSDSENYVDKEARKSVFEWEIYFLGA